jgi:hypothetical protein
MIAVTETPNALRREISGSWAVLEMQPNRVTMPRFHPVINLSNIDAQEMATQLNRNTVAVPARLHRYAMQGLPGGWP